MNGPLPPADDLAGSDGPDTALRERALSALLHRVTVVAGQVGDRFPLYADPSSGRWVSTRRGSWTGGFWAGWWWLRAEVTGQTDDVSTARQWCRRLLPRTGDDTVTRGMTFWYGAGVAGGGDPVARQVADAGAVALAASFDPRHGLIPVSTAFHPDATPRAAVDALAGTVRLLGFAADAGHRHLDTVARRHTGEHVRLLVDGEGRIRPEVDLPPPADADAGAGAGAGSWSRGQAWGVLGLAAAARRWDEFAAPARRVAGWWLDRYGTRVPPAVVGHPHGLVDTSAAVIAAMGLLDLSEVTSESHWGEAARLLVDRVIRGHLDEDGVLRDGCYDVATGVGTRHELIWGSFFLTGVLARLTGRLRRTG